MSSVRDLARNGVRGALGRESLDRAGWLLAMGMNVAMSAMTSATRRPLMKLGQVEPVRADIADRPQRAARIGLEPPVPVGVVEQPVLEVVAADQPDVAQRRRRR